jgi:cobyric acid synthase
VINKFRGAPELLDSGLSLLHQLTGRPVYGVLPWREGLWLDAEDSLVLSGGTHHDPFRKKDLLRVAVVKLPRISNFTDADALAAEPGVLVRFTDNPAELADADLVVLPGSRATVADLAWLRERGLAGAEPFLDGCRRGAVWGTSWHGVLENDEFRRAFLAEVATLAGRDFTPAPDTEFAAVRQARLDVLADLVAEYLDTAALSRLITGGPPPGLPSLLVSLDHDR